MISIRILQKLWLLLYVCMHVLIIRIIFQVYEIYKSRTSNELFCLIKFGGSVNGYLGVVHGGITAAVFDNSFGWLLMACNLPVSFTANINVNYR